MGLRGSVRRNMDGHVIHTNCDTDVIVSEVGSGKCLACAWDVLGMCVGCAWNAWHVHGMCVGCARHVRRMSLACAWDVLGMCVGCAWDVLGMCVGCSAPMLCARPQFRKEAPFLPGESSCMRVCVCACVCVCVRVCVQGCGCGCGWVGADRERSRKQSPHVAETPDPARMWETCLREYGGAQACVPAWVPWPPGAYLPFPHGCVYFA